jgi:hypothetical protein
VPLRGERANLRKLLSEFRSFVALTVMGSVLFASNTDEIARVIVERVLVLVMND